MWARLLDGFGAVHKAWQQWLESGQEAIPSTQLLQGMKLRSMLGIECGM